MVIDYNSRVITLPKTFGRKEKMDIGLDEIKEVRLDVAEHRGGRIYSYSYVPSLRIKSNEENCKLANWYDRDKAEDFVKWLKEQLSEGR